ncbi:MAG: hypothetical protein A2Y34_01525 [Spirochaetes bacterium GWC1_27_15]|nr:MAG: hypothetical protein A2Z98_07095 [Spirochaetes bacterium GWB1_27_13]OHD21509.1 MAG: hypothetical protein A2Y34_01525 [Spirochaetes bacterium GWC1_27_15]
MLEKVFNSKIFKELSIIISLILLFVNVSFFSKIKSFDIFTLFLIIIDLFFILLITIFFIFYIKNNKYKLIIPRIKENWLIWIFIGFYIILKLLYIDFLPRWDGGTYFSILLSTIDNYKLSLDSFLMNFNWLGHPSMGYVSFISISQFLDRGNEVLLNLTNTILTIIALLMFYKIILYFNGNKIKDAVFGTMFLALNPLFFAVSLTLSLDFPLLIFFIFITYFLIYNKKIYYIFFSLIFIFIKETGILIYLLFVFSVFIMVLKYTIFNRNKLVNNNEFLSGLFSTNLKTKIINLLLISIPVIALFLYLIYMRGNLWTGNEDATGKTTIKWDNNGFNCFGFNEKIISDRLFEIFALNFNWIITTIIAISLLFYLFNTIKDKKLKELLNNEKIWLLLVFFAIFIGFILFNLLFITYTHPRYIIYSLFFLILLFSVSALYLIKNDKIRYIFYCISLFFFIFQLFETVDPISSLYFKTVNFGNHKILRVASDSKVYNAQYAVIDRLFNKVNKEVKINENTTIITDDTSDDKAWESYFNYGKYAIYGDDMRLDKDTFRRTYKTGNSFKINKVVSIYKINKKNIPQADYYLYIPYLTISESIGLSKIKKYYDINLYKTVKYLGYEMKIYNLKSKK